MVEAWENIFNNSIIRISKNKIVYNTRLVEEHRIDPIKKRTKENTRPKKNLKD